MAVLQSPRHAGSPGIILAVADAPPLQLNIITPSKPSHISHSGVLHHVTVPRSNRAATKVQECKFNQAFNSSSASLLLRRKAHIRVVIASKHELMTFLALVLVSPFQGSV